MENEPKQQYPDLVKLGMRIRELRKAAGHSSQDTFAYDHGISRAQYGRYETGHNLTYLTLLKLSRAFGISLSEMLQGLD